MSSNKDNDKDKAIPLILAALALALTAIDAIKSIIISLGSGEWRNIAGRVIILIFIALVAYIYRDLITGGWDIFKKRGDMARDRVEKSKDSIDIREAVIFSLSWSREIYRNIPPDRKRYVKTSFILIGLALGISVILMDSISLLPILVIMTLLLAGVNLLIWVVGSERNETERISIELEAARKMQLSLMPKKAPEVQGFDIAGCCIPALNVGGDLFDYVWTGGENRVLCISVVDVSGKGMDAALTAVYTSGAIVSETRHPGDITTFIGNLNSAIFSRGIRTRFVSMLMANLDVAGKSLRYVNAGQSRPMLLRDGEIHVLKNPGPRYPLGVLPAPDYMAGDLKFHNGDCLLLYTDGVTEAMNEKTEMYGETRLKSLFLRLAAQHSHSEVLVRELKDEILAFSGTEYQHDDLTIVVVRVVA